MMFALFACLALLAGTLARPHQKRAVNGPVISQNFQDPTIIQVDGTWYAYSGPNGNPAVNIQMATSQDFVHWTLSPGYDVLPYAGNWAASVPHLWAPDINRLGNGQFVMYYSAATAISPSKHCVGAATADHPAGPFIAQPAPLFCDIASGGAIDPNGAFDPQSQNQYVVYKVDGNSNGHGGACSNTVAPIQPTPIVLQQVSTIDGITIVGPAITILSNIAEDGPMIEAPALTYDSSSQTYVLFYNSGCFTDPTYTVKYATSDSIDGPYTRHGTFLDSASSGVYIPGGIDVTGDGSQAVFHGDTNQGWFNGDGSKRVRSMYTIDLVVGGQSVLPALA